MLFRLIKLYEEGRISLGMIAMAKAHISKNEIGMVCREVLGGEGILLEHGAIISRMDG